jgi:hypothetical protein
MKTLNACSFTAREVWDLFQHQFTDIGSIAFADLLLLQYGDFKETMMNTTIAWNIWKRRNALVFNGIDEDLSVVAK